LISCNRQELPAVFAKNKNIKKLQRPVVSAIQFSKINANPILKYQAATWYRQGHIKTAQLSLPPCFKGETFILL